MEEEEQAGAVMVFQAYDRPLEIVSSFKYLGCLLTATDDDCPEVVTRTQKAQKSWAIMPSILGREGMDNWMLDKFYLAIVQDILIFGAETLVGTSRIGQMLRVFHHRVARWILGKQPRRQDDGTWDYPPPIGGSYS